ILLHPNRTHPICWSGSGFSLRVLVLARTKPHWLNPAPLSVTRKEDCPARGLGCPSLRPVSLGRLRRDPRYSSHREIPACLFSTPDPQCARLLPHSLLARIESYRRPWPRRVRVHTRPWCPLPESSSLPFRQPRVPLLPPAPAT